MICQWNKTGLFSSDLDNKMADFIAYFIVYGFFCLSAVRLIACSNKTPVCFCIILSQLHISGFQVSVSSHQKRITL